MVANLLHNDHHDYGPTEKELAHVLTYITNASFHLVMLDAHTPGTAALEECQDRGLDALLYAWQVWDSGRGVPFYAFARSICWRRMRGATARYQTWALPGSHSLPDADQCGRVVVHGRVSGTRELACRPPESMAWFFRDIARHFSCMSPCMQQTLRDTLAGLTTEDIAERDHVSFQAKHSRYAGLVTFLRRHVYDRETSCEEETAAWQHGTHQVRVDPAERQAKARASKKQWVAAHRERHLANRRAWQQARKAGASLAAAD